MGLNIPSTSQLYPWTALAYVKVASRSLHVVLRFIYDQGNIDATDYPNDGTLSGLSKVHVQAQASVLAWSYAAIGEFCDSNGQSGVSDWL
jgi:hypothetical protein